jgi:hypothetical protein
VPTPFVAVVREQRCRRNGGVTARRSSVGPP